MSVTLQNLEPWSQEQVYRTKFCAQCMYDCITIGLGGGYNERENVEYIEREESDDEYDDVSTNSYNCHVKLVHNGHPWDHA